MNPTRRKIILALMCGPPAVLALSHEAAARGGRRLRLGGHSAGASCNSHRDAAARERCRQRQHEKSMGRWGLLLGLAVVGLILAGRNSAE